MGALRGLYDQFVLRFVVLNDRLRTWRFRLLAALLWDVLVIVVVGDFARARWKLHLWNPEHWRTLERLWLDTGNGRGGFNDDFVATAAIAAIAIGIGTLAMPFVKSEDFFETIGEKLGALFGKLPAMFSRGSQRNAEAAGRKEPVAVNPAFLRTPAEPAAPAPTPASRPADPPPSIAAVPPQEEKQEAKVKPVEVPVAVETPQEPPLVETVTEQDLSGFDTVLDMFAPTWGAPPAVSTETLLDILEEMLKKAGYRILANIVMRPGRAWNFVALAADRILLVMVDDVAHGPWTGDETGDLVASSNWYVQGDPDAPEHPSPVLEAAKLAEEFWAKAETALPGFERSSLRPVVILTEAFIEDAESRKEVWDGMGVSVMCMPDLPGFPSNSGPKATFDEFRPDEVEAGDPANHHRLAELFGAVISV